MNLKHLSDKEILNIIFSFSQPRLFFGEKLLQASGGSLSRLLRSGAQWLQSQPGIGGKKAYRIAAVLELLRRNEENGLKQENIFAEMAALKRYLRFTLEYESREIFLALFLDAQHQLIASKELFFGSVTHVAIYPREILRQALLHQAAAFIVAHNHPSGDLKPSESDFEMTTLLHQACALLELHFLDHFLVSGSMVFSFVDHGWMHSAIECS